MRTPPLFGHRTARSPAALQMFRHLIQIIDVASSAIIARVNAQIADTNLARPQESSGTVRPGRISDHMAVLIDAQGLSTIVAGSSGIRQGRPEVSDKWNDRLSSIRGSSDFSRIVDTEADYIRRVKLTKMLWVPTVA